MRFFRILFHLTEAFFLLGIAIFIYAWRIEPRWVEWNTIDMPIKNLPQNLIDKKLVQISDIHIGEHVNDDFIIDEFQKINNVNPDIVAYTGDFISPVRINHAPFDQLEHILKHSARGKLATVAILGNHDYSVLARDGVVADSICRLLEKYDITVLRNAVIDINGLHISGIDDYWGRNFYPNKVLDCIDNTKANIVLCHNPDVVDLDIWNGYNSWVLAGHTHGGQVRIPFGKTIRIPVDNKNYDSGIKNIDDGRTLYINKGIGHSIRIRFNVRPEVTFFNLKKAG